MRMKRTERLLSGDSKIMRTEEEPEATVELPLPEKVEDETF